MGAGGIAVLCGFASASASDALPRTVAHPIPAFARKYRTSCSTCHTAAPKLNVLGEAFRLNGYRLPENDALLRRDDPVPLGAEPWKELWPRAIWPGDIPGYVPIALRVQNDAQLTRKPNGEFAWTLRFPHEIYLLAGATLGEQFAAFLEMEWSKDNGVEVVQAKIEFQNVLPWLPHRSLNLWVGMQNLYLLTFGDRQIDRAARQNFLWQEYRISDLELRNPGTGETIRSANGFQLRHAQPAVEVNGLIAGRFYYGVGLAQGAGGQAVDDNNRKDVYYKIRYKFGGLGLDGLYGPGGAPVLGSGGQLLDRSLIVEHFGYFGAQPVEGDRQDAHRSFGVNARVLHGRIDFGVGYVWGRNEDPWGDRASGQVPYGSVFGKAEYLIFPWLIGSLKFDTFDAEVPVSVRESGFREGSLNQTRVLPGLVVLLRQNIRGVLEAEFFTEHAAAAERNERKPHNLWLRLDVAF